MGIQQKNGMIYGKVGSVIYRRWRGLNIVQGLPRKVQQSVPTQAAAAEFGLASSSSADLRNFLCPLYKQDDVRMKNRLTRQVLRAIQNSPGRERLDRDLHDADLSHLQNFQFNDACSLQEALGVNPCVEMNNNGMTSVFIPALTASGIRYNGDRSGGFTYRLRIVAVGLDFRRRQMEVLEKVDIELRGDLSATNIPLCGPQACGRIVLVGMALYAEQRYGEDVLLLNSRSWSPAAILGMMHVSEESSSVDEEDAGRKALCEEEQSLTHFCHPGSSKYSIPDYLKRAYWLGLQPRAGVLLEQSVDWEKGMVFCRN